MESGPQWGVSFMMDFVDNVSPVVERISGVNSNMAQVTKQTRAEIDSQTISFMGSVMAVRALHGGFGALIMSGKELGLVNDHVQQSLMRMNAVIGIVAGSFQMLRGGAQIFRMIAAAELQVAGIETYRAVLRNPLMIGAVAMGLSAAAGAVGYMVGRSEGGGSSVTQNVTFGNYSQDERATARATIEGMGG